MKFQPTKIKYVKLKQNTKWYRIKFKFKLKFKVQTSTNKRFDLNLNDTIN